MSKTIYHFFLIANIFVRFQINRRSVIKSRIVAFISATELFANAQKILSLMWLFRRSQENYVGARLFMRCTFYRIVSRAI